MEWISVEEKLPEYDEYVSVQLSTKNVLHDATLTRFYGLVWLGHEINPTHWMPPPEPPE